MKQRSLSVILPVLLFIATSFTGTRQVKKIIFFGDSITELGVKPGGFVTLLDSIAKSSNKQFEMIGSGISADKVTDLYLRLEKDVLEKSPSTVVIYIGVNDVWHKSSFGTGTDSHKFERFYAAILQKLKERNIQAVLCTPAVIGEKTDFSNEQDGDLNKYSNIIRELAKKNDLKLVDLRQKFLDYNKQNNKDNKESGILTYDRVHLNSRGNVVVANAIWDVLKDL